MVTLEDIGPELDLWGAVVAQLIEDALDYHRIGPDRDGYRFEAHLELHRPGRMLQRLCGLAGVDPELVLDSYRRRLAAGSPRGIFNSPSHKAESARITFQP